MNLRQAADTLETVLAASEAEHTEAWLHAGGVGSTRFANNAITQNVADENANVSITCAFGQRVGHARTNDLSVDALKAAVRRAEDIARASEPDTEYLPPLGPQEYEQVQAHASSTAECSPTKRAEIVRQAVSVAEKTGLRSAGSVATRESFVALANSAGLRAHHRQTGARLTVTAMTDSSSGWASASHEDVDELAVEEIASRATSKADRSRDPVEVEPQAYTVVLEPAAVSDLLGYIAWGMDAKSADEGRSAFKGLEGKTIAGDNISLRSDPTDPDCPGQPFGGGGMPTQKRHWVRCGRVESLIYSRFWAQKSGHEVTGHPANVLMEGNGATVDELVSTVERGLLITRFWYIRYVDPMELLLTGMTRDGTFLIEDGEVRGGVKNMRFNFSPLQMLKNVVALGAPVRAGSSMRVPPLVVREFQFSSGTSF